MKKLLTLAVAIAATILSANAQYSYGSTYGTSTYGTNTNSTYVNGYTKSNGTYVTPTYTQELPEAEQRTTQPELTTMVVDIPSIPARAEVNTTSTAMVTRHTFPNVDNF